MVRFVFHAQARKALEALGYDLKQEAKELKQEYKESPHDFPQVRDYPDPKHERAGYRAEYRQMNFAEEGEEVYIQVF